MAVNKVFEKYDWKKTAMKALEVFGIAGGIALATWLVQLLGGLSSADPTTALVLGVLMSLVKGVLDYLKHKDLGK